MVKIFFEVNLTGLQTSSREIFKKYKERDDYFLKISEDFKEKQTLNQDNLLGAQKKDQEILRWIREHTGENAPKKNPPPHTSLLALAIIGLVYIFSSFLIQIS